MNEFEQVVETIKDYGAERIILFGSRVSGQSSENSDYDLAVIKPTDRPYHQRLKELHMKLRTHLPIDLFVFTPEEFQQAQVENSFMTEIAEKGQIIYERE